MTLRVDVSGGVDYKYFSMCVAGFGDANFFNLCGMQLAPKHTRKSGCTQVSFASYILKSQGNDDNASDKSMCVCVCVCVTTLSLKGFQIILH